MGIEKKERSGSGGNYVYLSKGNLVTYPDGKKTIHENAALKGHVLGIDFDLRKDSKGEEQEVILVFMMGSENDSYTLCFPFESGYGAAFCKLAKNVDWSMVMEISASMTDKDGKNYTSLFIAQPNKEGNWENIKWAYKESEPGKMPPPKIVKVGNKEMKDYTERNDFFRKLLVDFVGKKLKKLHPDFDPAKAKAKAKENPNSGGEPPVDDLPF